ncbi:hypothetical protein IFR09_15630 [Pseudomonas syringae]|nr:hypothetical protein [Pseudomonas syringae]MBD8793399.1 hypothetical protein [Pseudomonas syringae]MBD8804001.1 hypothetical protein [Pseudomonas syringae]MBD8812595.1 hypothetical protein [Pseudomonas syringae]
MTEFQQSPALKRAGEEALDLTIRYRMMDVLGMLTGKPIVSLQIQASQAQMVHIISEVALMQPGIKRIALQKRISQELQALEKEPGGFLTAVVDVISAFEVKAQGDVPIYRLRLLTAALGIAIATVTRLNLMTAGIAFVAFLVLAGLSLLGEWLINLVRDNKIEVWLGQPPFGIDRPEKFESLTAQNKAWQKLINPNNGMFQ